MNFSDIPDMIRDRSIVLFSPRIRSRSALLSYFLQQGAETYYYSLVPSEKTLTQFLSGLGASIRDTYDPRFGRQLEQALSERAAPEELADALIADLAKAKPKPTYLIVDNFDFLSHHADVTTFFHRFAYKIGKGQQLVVNSRNLGMEPWASLVRAARATVLADEQTLDGGIYDAEKPEAPHLEVYSLAGSAVYVNGMPLNTWDGPLPRHLFYFFVDHPMVTRNEIFETFWPDLPVKEATNVFHVTKRKISERLGFELTSYGGGFYRPSSGMQLHYDANRFESLLKLDDDRRHKKVPMEWYQALHLYRNPFLSQMDMPWIQKRRDGLKLTYTRALIEIARIHTTTGDYDRAVIYDLRALREYPEREDVHRDLMALYVAQGQPDKAVEQYRLLADILHRNLGITPSKKTREFYKAQLGSEPE